MRESTVHTLGFWIFAAAVAHALLCILGILALIELQKSQFRSAVQEVQQQVQERAKPKLYDEPLDRR